MNDREIKRLGTQFTRDLFRKIAAVAILRRGYEIQPSDGRFAAGSAQFFAIRKGEKIRVAVRTSLTREIGLKRRADGEWRTVPSADLVLAAVQGLDGNSADVFAFDAEALLGRFNRAVKNERSRDLTRPIFLALDKVPRKKSKSLDSDIKSIALWKEKVAFDNETKEAADKLKKQSFFDRVKRDFAQMNGVDVHKVSLEFRIIE